MLRRFIPVFCALLLLVAQHGALSHAVWHAYKAPHAQACAAYECEDAYSSSSEKPSRPKDLCVFDLAFGQVLGGAHGACTPLAFAPAVVERIHDLTASRIYAATLSPRSRGPPALL